MKPERRKLWSSTPPVRIHAIADIEMLQKLPNIKSKVQKASGLELRRPQFIIHINNVY